MDLMRFFCGDIQEDSARATAVREAQQKEPHTWDKTSAWVERAASLEEVKKYCWLSRSVARSGWRAGPTAALRWRLRFLTALMTAVEFSTAYLRRSSTSALKAASTAGSLPCSVRIIACKQACLVNTEAVLQAPVLQAPGDKKEPRGCCKGAEKGLWSVVTGVFVVDRDPPQAPPLSL